MVMFPGGWRILGAVLLLLSGARAMAGGETRDFKVSVDGKLAGSYHMTIADEKDGAVKMIGQAEIKVKFLGVTGYSYSYGGSELWKDGKLISFASRCNDDGKNLEVSAVSDGKVLLIKANGDEVKASVDTWPTSFWHLPDAKMRKADVPLMDADTGKVMSAKMKLIGEEKMTVCGKAQTCTHYRLSGDSKADLWYDGDERLVREEWMEDGHKTLLELSRLSK